MPTYQSSKHIREALDSILSQTVMPSRVILSDDGSTDDTATVITDMAVHAAVPIQFVRNKSRSGITANYLNALRQVKSCNLVAVADHDDVWLPDRLETIASAFQKSPHATLVSCDSLVVNEQLVPTTRTIRGGYMKSMEICKRHHRMGSFPSFLKGRLPCLAHTTAFRAEIIPELLDKPVEIQPWFFEEWLVSVAACYGEVILIPNALTLYRQHESQTTRAAAASKQAQSSRGVEIALSKDQLRVSKLAFCRSLLEKQFSNPSKRVAAQKKAALLEAAINFLQVRHFALVGRQEIARSILSIFQRFLAGDYFRYASGVPSFCVDVISVMSLHFRRRGSD